MPSVPVSIIKSILYIIFGHVGFGFHVNVNLTVVYVTYRSHYMCGMCILFGRCQYASQVLVILRHADQQEPSTGLCRLENLPESLP